jgi:putative membrane protein
MHQLTKFGTGAAAFAALFVGSLAAQTGHMANRMGSDNDFITKAARGGMAEVELGKLAVSKATDSKVKSFGQKMVDDHSKANDKLSTLAADKGVLMPNSLTSSDQSTVDKLSKLSGHDFDESYMEDMVKDHKADISEFEKESQNGRDPDVKGFAAKTLPTLQEHLRMAEDTLAAVKK